MSVIISNRQSDIPIDSVYVKKVSQVAMDYLGISKDELSVSFVTEEEAEALNLKYREKNYPAEVLSFPSEEKPVIGDVVIAPRLSYQMAESENVSFEYRLVYMLVHGILHLTGESHSNESQAGKMEAIEEKVIEVLKKKGLV